MRIATRTLAFVLAVSALAPVPGLCGAGDDAFSAFGLKDFPRALTAAQAGAKADDAVAQLVLGRLYAEGKGVPLDAGEAEKWFKRALDAAQPAAKKGDARALYALGRLTEGGWAGLSKDPAKAVSLYRKSADQGYAPAQFSLAYLYSHGAGVPRDAKQGLSWYEKAAEGGLAAAQLNLAFMCHRGEDVKKDQARAAALFRKAAEQGAAPAQYMLGSYREEGLGGLAKDENEALSWYRKAAAQGFTPESRTRKPGDLWEKAQSPALASAAATSAPSAPAPDIMTMIGAAPAAQSKSDVPFAEADDLIAKGKLDAALKVLEEIRQNLGQDDPTRVGCYRREGTVRFRLGSVAKAREAFTAGVALAKKLKFRGPEAADCYIGLSDCLKAKKDLKNALRVLQKALDAGPSEVSLKKINSRIRRLQVQIAAADAAAPSASTAAAVSPAAAPPQKTHAAPAAEPAAVPAAEPASGSAPDQPASPPAMQN